MLNVLLRKTNTLLHDPRRAIRGKFAKFAPIGNRRALAYLERNGVLDVLRSGRKEEHTIMPFHLYNLHRLIRKRRPLKVLEFGVGFSTLVMAHAIRQNFLDAQRMESGLNGENRGMIWSVETNSKWKENTERKIPDDLRAFIDIRLSDAEVCVVAGELCHQYSELPNIIPDFLYLDGPTPFDVKGQIRGLEFIQEGGASRPPVSADLLLLEAALRPGFLMLIDGRDSNMQFLKRHLKRQYKVRQNLVHHVSTFELVA